MAVAAAVVAVPVAVVAAAAVAADAGKALRLHLKQQEAPRCVSAAGLLLFENLISFQHSRSSAASARCTDSAIYSTDPAPVWRADYVRLIRRWNRTGRPGFKFSGALADTVLVRILNVKVMANSYVKKVSGDGGARSH